MAECTSKFGLMSNYRTNSLVFCNFDENFMLIFFCIIINYFEISETPNVFYNIVKVLRIVPEAPNKITRLLLSFIRENASVSNA